MNNWTTSPGSRSNELIYKQETFDIIRAAIQVHRFLGFGFLEPVYQESMEIELNHMKVPNDPQKKLSLYYRERKLKKYYQPDFVCFGKIVVEIKALEKLTNKAIAQALNSLRVTGMKLALLINFGSTRKLEWKRVVL